MSSDPPPNGQILSDEILPALAHADRRRLLRLCRDDPMAAPSVSEHQKVLRKTGLAQVEKSGKFWLYSTNTARLAEVLRALEHDLLEGPTDD